MANEKADSWATEETVLVVVVDWHPHHQGLVRVAAAVDFLLGVGHIGRQGRDVRCGGSDEAGSAAVLERGGLAARSPFDDGQVRGGDGCLRYAEETLVVGVVGKVLEHRFRLDFLPVDYDTLK